MSIPHAHDAIFVAGQCFDLDHLNSFTGSIPRKGVEPGSDLPVAVVFSNHVYTRRAKHGEAHHRRDHHGTRRVFDKARYDMSVALPGLIAQNIRQDSLTFVSKSFGGANNLIFLEDHMGRIWTVVFCLVATVGNSAVRMEVLSAHPKVVAQQKISRKHLSYFARSCLFGDSKRVPKQTGPSRS